MEKLFIEILNMSLTASYVILFVLTARFFLKRVPKIFSYLLWTVVGFRLIIPFSFESVWSLIPSGGESLPIPSPIGSSPAPQPTIEATTVDNMANQSPPVAAPVTSVDSMQLWLGVGEAVWIIGAIALLGYSVFSILRLKRQLRFAYYTGEGIYIAEGLKTPFILGMIRPKIYLPSGLSADEQAYVLQHEKTHIARYDHVIKPIAFLLLCLHWFNPLVWVAFICMSRDMEMSCDESVIRKMGHCVKQGYSASLLSMAVGRSILNGSPLAFGEGEVKGRIQNILKYKSPKLWVGIVGVLILTILGFGLLANPLQTKGSPILEASHMATEEWFSSYHAETYVVSEGIELVFQMDEIEKITDLQAFVQDLYVEEKEISLDRSENREKAHQLVFYRAGAERVYLAFHFNKDFSVVWIDNGIKPSMSYQVIDSEEAKQFFTKLLHDQVSNEWTEKLLSKQLKYVGDAPGVGRIVSLLKIPSELRLENGMELQTTKEPYGIILPFTTEPWILESYQKEEKRQILREQAYILFALIDNVGFVEMRLSDGNEETVIRVTREAANQAKGRDVREFRESTERFRAFLQGTIATPTVGSIEQQPMIYFQNQLYVQTRVEPKVAIAGLVQMGEVQNVVHATEVPNANLTANRADLLGAKIHGFSNQINVIQNGEHKLFKRVMNSLEQEILNELQQYREDYKPEMGVKEGVFVEVHGKYDNESVMKDFIQTSQSDKQAEMTMVQYTIEGDPIFTSIVFDGDWFYVVTDYERDAFGGGKSAYRYANLQIVESTDGKQGYAVLTNEEKLTYEEFTQRMLSSVVPFDGQIIYAYEK